MSKRQRYIESLPLFPDHVAEYVVKGGNGMTPEMKENLEYNLRQDAIAEKIEEVLDECLEAYDVVRDRPDGKTRCLEDREAIVRTILLTAANLWGL